MNDFLLQWEYFKSNIPHQRLPYSKKNWGNPNHSLCSYQGKLKPAIAHFLVKTFVPSNGIVFDPFAGVGTIPFEAALSGKKSFGMDISPLAYIVSSAKIGHSNKNECFEEIDKILDWINTLDISPKSFQCASNFGYNKTLGEYYEQRTFREILIARDYYKKNPPITASQCLVCASLLHILHGNRPYALSRKSHPIVPYAPTGDYQYKNLIEKLTQKVERALQAEIPDTFQEGKIFLSDSTKKWSDEINNLDAIITSPPFFDSTKFSMANWIRLWFLGWETEDFKQQPTQYVDELQKKDIHIYDSIFQQSKDRLKNGAFFVLHLGKNNKCDMGIALTSIAKKYFSNIDLFDESVVDCEKFGIRDMGGVTSHEYLICY